MSDLPEWKKSTLSSPLHIKFTEHGTDRRRHYFFPEFSFPQANIYPFYILISLFFNDFTPQWVGSMPEFLTFDEKLPALRFKMLRQKSWILLTESNRTRLSPPVTFKCWTQPTVVWELLPWKLRKSFPQLRILSKQSSSQGNVSLHVHSIEMVRENLSQKTSHSQRSSLRLRALPGSLKTIILVLHRQDRTWALRWSTGVLQPGKSQKNENKLTKRA